MSSVRKPERRQSIATAVVFCVFIAALSLAHLLLPDNEVSRAERRKLQQLPELSVQTLFSGEYMAGFEDYFSDQFPMRDKFRALESYFCFCILRQMDNRGVYIIDGTVFKSDPTLDEEAVSLTAKKLNEIIEEYLDESADVWYSVIPDKNYFAADLGYPTMDYGKMLSILDEELNNISYIDIFETLDITDYYRTDIHWRQEKLTDTARVLLSALGIPHTDSEYIQHRLYPFYGSYYSQAGLAVEPDELIYLTSPLMDSVVVTALDPNAENSVYVPGRIDGMDGYDVFISGAQSVITMETESGSGRELILFRDSFGSSIAPLLLEGYSKITLVDLRYISSDRLGDYVDFENADVLFLYSTALINNGGVLK